MSQKHFPYVLFLGQAIVPSMASLGGSTYEIVSRRRALQWADIEDEANISFDGDVAAIQALALEKASSIVESDGQEEEEDLAVPSTCDFTQTENLLTVEFEYIIEYDESGFSPASRLEQTQADTIVVALEKELQSLLSTMILECNTESPEVKEASIVGLVRSPEDKASEERKWHLFCSKSTLGLTIMTQSHMTKC